MINCSNLHLAQCYGIILLVCMQYREEKIKDAHHSGRFRLSIWKLLRSSQTCRNTSYPPDTTLSSHTHICMLRLSMGNEKGGSSYPTPIPACAVCLPVCLSASQREVILHCSLFFFLFNVLCKSCGEITGARSPPFVTDRTPFQRDYDAVALLSFSFLLKPGYQ